MKVAFICPTYFDPGSVLAGAERYAFELARAMARKVSVKFISFGRREFRDSGHGFDFQCFRAPFYIKSNVGNPFNLAFLKALAGADVVHALQFRTFATDLALLRACVVRAKVFVTDLGGNTDFALSNYLPLWKKIRGLLLISRASQEAYRSLSVPSRVIYGGVDTDSFCPGAGPRSSKILFVGRLIPAKGIEYLIEALEPGMELEIAGQPLDPSYLENLKRLAAGRRVSFLTNIGDAELLEKYRGALVTVNPAVLEGGYTTVMESMACGTPVISTDEASLPEIVRQGETGFLVPVRDAGAIRESLRKFYAAPGLAGEMGKKGRADMRARFNWNRVVDDCLEFYEKM